MPEIMLKNISDAAKRVIQIGRKQQSRSLMELLKKTSTGFNGLAGFDNEQVPSPFPIEPLNCWMLTVVILTSIAIGIPNIAVQEVERMIHNISEDFRYISLVEKDRDSKGYPTMWLS